MYHAYMYYTRRRYTYTAVPELGGMKFENGSTVQAFLDLLVGCEEYEALVMITGCEGEESCHQKNLAESSFLRTPIILILFDPLSSSLVA